MYNSTTLQLEWVKKSW